MKGLNLVLVAVVLSALLFSFLAVLSVPKVMYEDILNEYEKKNITWEQLAQAHPENMQLQMIVLSRAALTENWTEYGSVAK